MKMLPSVVYREGDPLYQMEPPPAVINCQNGELWLSSDAPELRPHNPGSGLTWCFPIRYDPAATCPTFVEAIYGVFRVDVVCLGELRVYDPIETADRVRHVEEQMGYVIQPDRFLKLWILWHGEGDNGKGKLVELLETIIGGDAVLATRINQNFEDRETRVADLSGKLLFIDDDLQAGTTLSDGLLKKISERKTMSGAHKFKDTFNFISVVVLMLSNNWPRCRDGSLGMLTRAQVVNFERSFLRSTECTPDHPDRQRPEIWEKVHREEMSGVLNRLIAGYYRVKRRGSFQVPTSCQAAKQDWIGEMNPLSLFVEDFGEKTDPDT